MTTPKLFISYCWSTPEHEQWVVNLATGLMEQGVEVILDKWDLREGQDAVQFMEKMVADPTVTKVIMVSDRAYAEKADGRAGGVGTETQIISREVYEGNAEGKFVAVIPEKDSEGKAYLPIYYKSRIYVDLSESERYPDNYEKLLRWIFDKPLYVKPTLGDKPAFLAETAGVNLGTTTTFTRAIDAIKTGKPFADGAIGEYLTVFTLNLERFRLSGLSDEKFDDKVVENIEQFLPFRDQYIQFLITLCKYHPTPETMEMVHRFFERLAPYMFRPRDVTSYSSVDFDNFKYIVHELFLYTFAVCISEGRFEFASYLLNTEYYLEGDQMGRESRAHSFVIFREHIATFEHRKQRLKLNRAELRADLILQYSKSTGVSFTSMMQADFILYLRDSLNSEGHWLWWPYTLIYVERHYGQFEVFARSQSAAYFSKVKPLLGVASVDELRQKLEKFKSSDMAPKWGFHRVPVITLIGPETIGKKA